MPQGTMWPVRGTRPAVGLIPQTPLKCDGRRMLPPVSLPMSNGDPPALTIAAAPPLDPPGVRSGLNGSESVRKPVVGLTRQRQLRSVRLAHQDRARSPQPSRNGRVRFRHKVLATQRSARRDNALGVVRVLERDWSSMQRTQIVAAGNRRVSLRRLRTSALGRGLNHSVQRRVDFVNPRQVRLQHLRRGHLPLADRPDDVGQ